ncbi:MAG: hypothetical protein NC938_00380 [Candidatus Omnitrophica bacterium]|nr:hypothetical protein [Candidatus Omnitrophota bacterium]
MIDRKTESDIKSVNGFLEFWMKFHSIFTETISKGIISVEEESKFLETRDMIKAKYEDLKKSLEFKYMPHGRMTDPVDDVLKISGIRFMSEKSLKRLNEDWRDSYVFLNNILERLKNKKRRLEEFNTVGVLMKRLLDASGAKLSALFKKGRSS